MDAIGNGMEELLSQKRQQLNEEIQKNQQELADHEEFVAHYEQHKNALEQEQDQIRTQIIAHYNEQAGNLAQAPQPNFQILSDAEVSGLRKSEKKAYRRNMERYRLQLERFRHQTVQAATQREMEHRQQLRTHDSQAESRRKEMDHRKKYADQIRRDLQGKGRLLQERNFLLQNKESAAALVALEKETDPVEKKKKARSFLQIAARVLLEHEEFGPQLREANEAVTEMGVVTANRLMLAEQGRSDMDVEAFDEAMVAYEERMNQNMDENLRVRVASFEVQNIFPEEFSKIDVLKNEVDSWEDEMQERTQETSEAFERFCQSLPEAMGIKLKEGESTFLTTPDDATSIFAVYSKKRTLEEFDRQVTERMEQKKLTKKQAEKEILQERRAAIQSRAAQIRVGANILGPDRYSQEEFAAHGGVTKHFVLPAGEALSMEEQSNGFMAAVPYGADGRLMEMRPSVPKTVQIEGRQVAFRRTYNYIMKAAFTSLLDENGKFKAQTESAAQDIDMLLMGTSKGSYKEEEVSKILDTRIRPALLSILEKKYETAEDPKSQAQEDCNQILSDMKLILRNSQTVFIRDEASIYSHYSPMNQFHEVSKEAVIQDAMKLQGVSRKEAESAYNGLLGDVLGTELMMKRIRDMDAEGKESPLPNTCSSNGIFVQNIKYSFMNEMVDEHFSFFYASGGETDHLHTHPKENLTFILENWDTFIHSVPDLSQKALERMKQNKPELQRLKEKLDGGEQLTPKEMNYYTNVVSPYVKYDWHMSSKLFSRNEKGQNVAYVAETFAATSNQISVGPFTLGGCIGMYKGANIGQEPLDLSEETVTNALINEYADWNHYSLEKQERLRGEMLVKLKRDYALSNEARNEGMEYFYSKDNPFMASRTDQIRAHMRGFIKAQG